MNHDMTDDQLRFLKARDENPGGKPAQWCDAADVSASDFIRWSLRTPENMAFLKAMTDRDHGRNVANDKASPEEQISHAMRVQRAAKSRPVTPSAPKLTEAERVPSGNPVEQVVQAKEAVPEARPALRTVATEPSESLPRTFNLDSNPRYAYQREMGKIYREALVRHHGNHEEALADHGVRNSGMTPSMLREWACIPEIRSEVDVLADGAASAAGKKAIGLYDLWMAYSKLDIESRKKNARDVTR